LRGLLENPTYSKRALQVAGQMRNEGGVATACNALEALLQPDT
jgi:UDP:flavonoid glycosyltransferase YjiC (YdhE family)